MPSGNLPRTLIIGGGAVFVIALVFVIGSLFLGKSGTKWQNYINLANRAAEIVRVSDIAAKDTKNSDVLSLIATTEATLTSQQNELNAYLKSQSVKQDPKLGNPYLNPKTDTALATALQNNALDSTYLSYLKTQLTKYQNQIRLAAPTAGANALAILKSELASTQTLLDSPQLK